MPKIIGDNLTEHRQKTRERLFASLSALLREQSFDAITMSQIAARAKMGRTAVYNHFPDKEALLLAFISHETEKYSHSLGRALAEVSDPLQRIRVYIRTQLELKTDYRLPNLVDLQNALPRITLAQLLEHAQVVETQLQTLLKEAVAAGQLPAQDVAAEVPLIHACLSGWNLPDEPLQAERFIHAAQDFVLRALGAKAELLAPPAEAEAPGAQGGPSLAEIMLSSRVGTGACPVESSRQYSPPPAVGICPVRHH